MKELLKKIVRLIKRPFSMGRDRKLACVECRNTFVFEAGEQDFYKSRGLSDPKRCPACRSRGDRRGRRGGGRPGGFGGRPHTR